MCELLSDVDALALLIDANLAEIGPGFVKTAGQVAMVQGVTISINPLEPTQHHKEHFHARFGDEENASYSIDTCELLVGQLKQSRHKAVKKWWSTRVDALRAEWKRAQNGEQPHKIAASLAQSGSEFVGDPTLSEACGNIGPVVMMEVDDFIKLICKIAKEQKLASDKDLKSISKHLGDRIYGIAKELCDLHRQSQQANIFSEEQEQSTGN